MNRSFPTNQEPMSFVLSLKSKAKIPVIIRVVDADPRTKNVFYKREVTMQGDRVVIVKLPTTPISAIIEIYNEVNGNKAKGVDKSFVVTSITKHPIKTYPSAFNFTDPLVQEWLKFRKEFAERSSWLSAGTYNKDNTGGSTYYSDNHNFRIDYFDHLMDYQKELQHPKTKQVRPNPNYGNPVKTPTRIGQESKIIQVGKDKWIDYTVLGREALLDHEVGHGYFNHNPMDEEEADSVGIRLSMGTGMPKIEMQNAWLEVFQHTPSDMNVARHKLITKQIENFHNVYG